MGSVECLNTTELDKSGLWKEGGRGGGGVGWEGRGQGGGISFEKYYQLP